MNCLTIAVAGYVVGMGISLLRQSVAGGPNTTHDTALFTSILAVALWSDIHE